MVDRAHTRHKMRRQVHVIVTEGRDGEWFKPELTAWSMRQGESRAGERIFLCEPADVVVLR